jgi:3-oxoacyl-[acyl-carrier-protein] synthase II
MTNAAESTLDPSGMTRLFTRPSIGPRRVVVTGLGVISSLGGNVADFWKSLIDGKSGIRRQDDWSPDVNTCVLHGNVRDSDIQQRFLESKAARNSSRFSRMALEAAGDALIDAGLIDAETYEPTADLSRGGAYLGTCVGGTYDDLLPAYDTWKERGPSRIPVHLHVKFPHNLAAFLIQHRWGMGGPSTTIATACATGAQAIGQAFHDIKYGRAPFMVAGAVESDYHLMFVSGFAAMKALCTDSNDDPEAASRPFDATRSGFILGEGSGMVVLEDYEHAVERGADIYAEISGFATSNDAYHLIAPQPEGTGAARAIGWALEDAGLTPNDIGFVNAHAASTPAGDVAEAEAIKLVFGDRASEIPVNSIKGAIGHCMGASGALETVSAILSLAEQKIPPTLNYANPDPEIGLDIVSGEAREATFQHVTKHSFGLGGQNACLVISEAPERAKRAPTR